MSKTNTARYYADGTGPRLMPFETDETGWYNELHVKQVYEHIEELDRHCVKAKSIEGDLNLSRGEIGKCLALIEKESGLLEAFAPDRPRNNVYVIQR